MRDEETQTLPIYKESRWEQVNTLTKTVRVRSTLTMELTVSWDMGDEEQAES